MKKYILLAVLLAAFMLIFPAQAQSQSRSFDLDFGLGFGKTGIGKGYSVSSAVRLSPRWSISPVVRYSWTGSVNVTNDPSVIVSGGTGTMSGSQWMFGLKPALTLATWKKHWEVGLSGENGFQKTIFRYHVTAEGRTFSDVEKRTGYYFLPAANLKYWISRRSNLSVTAGVVAHGDPTDGDGLGRAILLVNYTHLFDLVKIGRFFKKRF